MRKMSKQSVTFITTGFYNHFVGKFSFEWGDMQYYSWNRDYIKGLDNYAIGIYSYRLFASSLNMFYSVDG